MTRIVIAGAIRLYRDGVALHLGRLPQFAIVATAEDGAQTLRAATEHAPDVVLLDMAMPDSLLTVRELAARVPSARVVALAVPEEGAAVISCAEAGVAGYVPRDGSLDDLVRAVEGAARDECTVSPRVAASMFRRLSALAADRVDERAARSPGATLTGREAEIARCLDDGLSNKQIAARLHIEVATVKNHVHNILEKLGVHRRGEIRSRLLADRRAREFGGARGELTR